MFKKKKYPRHILQLLDPQHIVQIVNARQCVHFASRPFRQILEQRLEPFQQLSIFRSVHVALQFVLESGTRSFGGQDLVHFLGNRVHRNGLPVNGRIPDIVLGRRPQTGQIGLGAHERSINVRGLNVEAILVVVRADQFGVAFLQPLAERVVLEFSDL